MKPHTRSPRSVRSRITSIAAVIAMVAAGAVLAAPAAAASTETHYHPDGVDAFYGNDITQLTIGNSVEVIGTGAFDDNPGLTSVVLSGLPPSLAAASDASPSFDTSSGSLVLTYPWRYDASRVSGGYTSPTRKGYDTQRAAPQSCRPFPDVDSSNAHCRNIEWLKDAAITKPIGGLYRPAAKVNRGSMAAFLHRIDNYMA